MDTNAISNMAPFSSLPPLEPVLKFLFVIANDARHPPSLPNGERDGVRGDFAKLFFRNEATPVDDN
jgi:hypothetical protein